MLFLLHSRLLCKSYSGRVCVSLWYRYCFFWRVIYPCTKAHICGEREGKGETPTHANCVRFSQFCHISYVIPSSEWCKLFHFYYPYWYEWLSKLFDSVLFHIKYAVLSFFLCCSANRSRNEISLDSFPFTQLCLNKCNCQSHIIYMITLSWNICMRIAVWIDVNKSNFHINGMTVHMSSSVNFNIQINTANSIAFNKEMNVQK